MTRAISLNARRSLDAPATDDGPASWLLVPVSEDHVFNFLCLVSFLNFLSTCRNLNAIVSTICCVCDFKSHPV